MIELNTRGKIIEKASVLFYSKGFNNTGMDEITRVVGVKKPTLYYHFESKNSLGLAYLEYRSTILFEMLESLQKRAKTFDQYLSNWATSLIMLARRNEFFGCPFTAFSSELDISERIYFINILRSIETEWLAMQERAYIKFYGRSNHARRVAEKILIVHTGCVMLYRSSRDIKYMRQLKVGFADVASDAKKLSNLAIK
ncbi:MAG: TetR/AcrR family transcriptional regulator [Leptospira sp.]|nr:TetR/AcrR family transcriptional regulator [Leptospira sp.]